MTEAEVYITIPHELNQRKFNVETEKVDKLIPNTPTGNINNLNELIQAGLKLV